MQILPGKYRHFKGGLYEVIGVARHSETLEEMVVYRALYGEGGLWVRPATMWNETVIRDGVTYRRFTPVTEGESIQITISLGEKPSSGGNTDTGNTDNTEG